MHTETRPSELLSIAEAAALLHVDPRTIKQRIRAGLLPAQTLTGSRIVRIERADVLAQLQAVPVPSVPPASPAIERLNTPEGRARALAVLDALRHAPADEIDDGWDLEQALAQNPLTFRTVILPDGDDE